MFHALGLDPKTEIVYRLFLDEPELRLDQIVARVGLGEQEVRDALDRLADLSLLDQAEVHAAGQPLFRATDPGAGLSYLLSRREAELAKQQRGLEAARTAVSTLTAYRTAHAPRGYDVVKRLEGRHEMCERLAELAELARIECLSLLPGCGQASDDMDAHRAIDQRALARGVRIRSVYQDSFRNAPETMRYVNWLGGLGGEVRTLPSLEAPMVLFDREVALVSLDPGDVWAGALELRSVGTVTVARLLFEEYWQRANPIGPTPPRDHHDLSPQEKELLRLLAKGHTDATVGRRLGVSLRTVRRMNADLTGRLAARSRFQTGAEAVRQGWI
ncbi:helix-turn-helix transcriptional regulator [Streptomyces albipurpureus]|uniref:Helix-turn-helix transcriptional regulator n=1 Tax=Streptomyces albipurpureus TaxID=2897419 RepID=A0ABT0UM53_9ACTN|nr:helix-turn-helix transcriptional regulator [Streptomyces sp. CWNU-1]MCM2389519.1 helix-turn-helix transcriptional regulator [Streptomyces sp. CWNU-1]